MRGMSKMDKYARLVLTFVLTAFSAWIFYSLMSRFVPDGNRDQVIYMAGAVTTLMVTAYNWWFSSSKGSEDKQQTIQKLTEKS